MSIRIEFPKTDLVHCRFPKINSDKSHTMCFRNSTCFDYQVKDYVYRVPRGVEVAVGDMVVVACATGFQVAFVTELNVTVPNSFVDDIAYVINKVDTSNYKKDIERAIKKKALGEEIRKKKKELEDQLSWELLAEHSPEFKALVEAFKALDE